MKRIFKWTVTLTTVTAAGMVLHMMLNDGAVSRWDQVLPERESKPLVKSNYYRDPLEGVQEPLGR